MGQKVETAGIGIRKLVQFWQSNGQARLTGDLLAARMHSGITVGVFEADYARETIDGEFSLAPNRHTPSWLNIDGLTSMISEFSAKDFWVDLIGYLPEDRMPVSLSAHNPEDIAFHLAKENMKFMSTALTAGMLAAAEGSLFESRNPTLPLVTFARDVGKRFEHPAQTPDEFIGRLQQLVPDPDRPSILPGSTLYNYLDSHDAFGAFSSETGKRCAGKPFTQIILSRFGSLLENDAVYRERFRSTVTNPEPQIRRRSLRGMLRSWRGNR